MDPIFDRLGNLLRSLFQDSDSDFDSSESFSDPDMQEAWEELNDYMKSGKTKEAPKDSSTQAYSSMPDELREDFKILSVPFGSPLDVVSKSYKKLLRENHPDKFANDPKKVATATEITKIYNRSYQRIKEHYRSKKN